MENPRQALMRHALALIGAIIFGLLLAGPFILIRTSHTFAALYPEIENDQSFYLSRIQDVREGYGMSGNSYLAEHKKVLPMQFLTGETVEAVILTILHLPTQNALWLFPLIFGPLIFIFTYLILFTLGVPRVWGVTITTLLLTTTFFFDFGRPISPQFNFVFWLIAVLQYLLVFKDTSLRRIAGAGVSTGFLFYVYPYYWTHLLAAYGIAFLAYLFSDRRTALRVALVTIGSIVVGSGYAVLAIAARGLPVAAESFARLGFVQTHFPSGAALTALALIALATCIFIVRKKEVATLSLLAGAVIAMNQHIVTGLNMEFSSHYAMQIIFGAVFAITAAVSMKPLWPHRAIIQGAAIAATVLIAIHGILPMYDIGASAIAADKDYIDHAALIEWLTDNPYGVVLAPEEIAISIPANTADDVLFARNANIAFMSDQEVYDRFILTHFRSTIDEKFIAAHERELFGHHYLNLYNHALQEHKVLKLFGITTMLPERISSDAIHAVEARAQVLQTKTFLTAATPYHLDYVIIDTSLTDSSRVEDLGNARLAFTAGRFEIFELKP